MKTPAVAATLTLTLALSATLVSAATASAPSSPTPPCPSGMRKVLGICRPHAFCLPQVPHYELDWKGGVFDLCCSSGSDLESCTWKPLCNDGLEPYGERGHDYCVPPKKKRPPESL